MKPYFEEDGITIYHGDCREILPILKLDDVVVISDPPYGINLNRQGSHRRFSNQGVTTAARARGNHPIVGDDGPFDPKHLVDRFENVILWGADHFYPRLPDRGRFLAWDKLNGMESWDSFCDVELAWHSHEGAARIFRMKWKGIACEKLGEDNGYRDHPTQKPKRLMYWCIEQSECSQVATVLDPYMGVGTTLACCRFPRRPAIGIEIEEKYCEIAAKRLSQKVMQF
jgi:site-specific DNA-methyltransferase (adenine-specific)